MEEQGLGLERLIQILRTPLKPSGFSLIEILIAVTILSIGLLGLAALQTLAIRENTTGKKNSMAVALAEQKIEELHNTPYEDIDTGSETEEDLGEGFNFVRETTVEDDTPASGMKRITVEVRWSDHASHKIRISTIISQNG